jgi:phenylalanyl-tRNA synthetase beta chain
MRISYNWLKEFVEFDLPPDELAHELTLTGTEIERVEHLPVPFKGVITAKITSLERREDLAICQVNAGGGKFTVACGAPNVEDGLLVPLAPPGAFLPGGREIGVKSFGELRSEGMICSEKELGLSDFGEGIMVLDGEYPLGTPLEEVLQMEDYILEADLTPNRPDCMSILGVAREVAAVLGVPLKLLQLPSSQAKEERVRVEVEDGEGCPRYTARIIEGVKVFPSPFWLRRRLESAGVRAVNNVVDVTNYVMMERGQPLHAFDWDRLRDQRIKVRRSRRGECLITLDGQERELGVGTLLICDGRGPVAIAGIMGGMEAEVSGETRNLFLESAYFDPLIIRRGSKRLGLITESSQRFERGVDPFGLIPAQERAAQLLLEVAQASSVGGTADISLRRFPLTSIKLKGERVNQVLGLNLEWEEIIDFLSSLGFDHKGEDLFSVPGYRPDVTREIDLVEEVARLYGYERIPADLRTRGLVPVRVDRRERKLRRIREILCGMGLREVVTNSLIDPRWAEVIGYKGKLVRLLNPLSRELSVLRPDLLPCLLWVVGLNLRRGSKGARIYELGNVFSPQEGMRLGGLIWGDQWPPYWGERDKGADFFSLKGIVEALMQSLRLEGVRFEPGDRLPYEKGGMADLIFGGNRVGTLGKLSPQIGSKFDLKGDLFCFDLDIDSLLELIPLEFKFNPPSKFPPVKRDLALLVAQEVPARSISETIRELGTPLLKEVLLFDLYQGKQVPSREKSLTFSLTFASPHSTLTDREVERVQERILEGLKERLGARIRD